MTSTKNLTLTDHVDAVVLEDADQRTIAHLLPILAWAVCAVGLYQAVPHMVFLAQMGASLCLAGEGASVLGFVASQVQHCWGCSVALFGAATALVSHKVT